MLFYYIGVSGNNVLQKTILIFVRVGMERQIYTHRARIVAVYFPLSDVACILVESAKSSGSLIRSVFMEFSLNIDKCVTFHITGIARSQIRDFLNSRRPDLVVNEYITQVVSTL